MNVYDFDGTILTGDTEVYFRRFIFKNYKISLKSKIEVLFYSTLYSFKLINVETFRNHFYVYLNELKSLDDTLKAFWLEHKKYIKDYYIKNHKEDDLIVSATPRFLFKYILDEIKVKNLIATEFDTTKCKVIGLVCKGEQKVNRYNEIYKGREFNEYYFDSDSDLPLMKYAINGFRVSEEGLNQVK